MALYYHRSHSEIDVMILFGSYEMRCTGAKKVAPDFPIQALLLSPEEGERTKPGVATPGSRWKMSQSPERAGDTVHLQASSSNAPPFSRPFRADRPSTLQPRISSWALFSRPIGTSKTGSKHLITEHFGSVPASEHFRYKPVPKKHRPVEFRLI